MTVRPPKALGPNFSTAGAFNVLEYELMSERADALGRHGLKVEKALAALAALKGDVARDLRERVLDEAADAVWAFLIQREICGLLTAAMWFAATAYPRRSWRGSASCAERRQRLSAASL